MSQRQRRVNQIRTVLYFFFFGLGAIVPYLMTGYMENPITHSATAQLLGLIIQLDIAMIGFAAVLITLGKTLARSLQLTVLVTTIIGLLFFASIIDSMIKLSHLLPNTDYPLPMRRNVFPPLLPFFAGTTILFYATLDNFGMSEVIYDSATDFERWVKRWRFRRRIMRQRK